MDYEKKYKEALERFKTFREKYCTYGELHFGDVIFDKTGEAQKDLDAIFPELKESGDERIRKELIEFIQWAEDRGMTRHDFHQAKRPSVWIAYLEKQKEQTADNQFPPLEGLDAIKAKYYDKGFKCGFDEGIDSAKPAEWSEEDDKIRRNLMSLLANMRGDRITEETYQKYYPWLKSLRPHWKPSEVCYGAKGDPGPAGVWKPSEEQPQVADASKMEQSEGYLEYWLEHFGMPKENIENCADQIAQGYGASRFLEGVQVGAEAVNELGKQEKGYDEAYLNECIAKASKSWEGVDADKYMDEVRDREQEQPEVDLEKEMDNNYDSPLWEGETVSWMTYTRIARHFYELGLNARKEETK